MPAFQSPEPRPHTAAASSDDSAQHSSAAWTAPRAIPRALPTSATTADDNDASAAPTTGDDADAGGNAVDADAPVKRPDGKWGCPRCEYTVTDGAARLALHILAHSKWAPLQCDVCNQSYARTSDLTRHMSAAHGMCKAAQQTQCRYCQQVRGCGG